MAGQVLAKEFFAEGDGIVFTRLVESGSLPGFFAAFHDPRGKMVLKRIGMHLKKSVFAFLEDKGEERKGRTESAIDKDDRSEASLNSRPKSSLLATKSNTAASA